MPKRAVRLYLPLVCLLCLSFSALPQDGHPKWVEGELLVKFRGGPGGPAARQAEQAFGLDVRRRFDRLGWQHVRIPPGQKETEVLARLRQRPDVLAAEPNYVFQLRNVEPNAIPNDPRFNEQWALRNIGATNAWALTAGDSNVVVAVLDTGIRYTHEDLAPNMWRNPGEIPANNIDDDNNGYVDDVFGIDPVNQDSDPMDQPVGFTYHGTACASIIGAAGNNGRGMAGINWPVRLMALRVAAASNFISAAWAAESFEYVLMMRERGVNVRVTSNSYGLDDAPSQALRDALEALGHAGVLSVFAAGNSSKNVDISCDYPACYRLPSTLTVAATDSADLLAPFSNYGPTNVDLAAPGVNITVANGISNTDYTSFFSGTSASCPYVAGAAALLWSAYPFATLTQIRAALMESVDLLPSLTNKMVSHGRLNVGRAIHHAGLVIGAPPHVLMPPSSQTVGLGYPATFCLINTGAEPIEYFWQLESSEVVQTTDPIVTIENIALSDAGTYRVVLSNAFGMATSAVATLTVVTEPTILAEPQGLRVLDGTNITFKVVAAGAFPLSYQWQRDGVDLVNETNATIAFLNTQGTMTGDYRAVLSNGHGSVTSAVARLTVLTRPHILVHPQSQTVAVGANVSLSVTVTNAATLPLGYRWRRGTSPGSTVTVLNEFISATNLLNIQTNLSGLWNVIITNEGPSSANIMLSSNAHLTVVVPPTNKTVVAGANATFNVIGVGPSPLTYQWQRNGANIPGATGTGLTLMNVQPGDAANYTVIVTNALGQPAGFTALLQVIGPPLITQPERLNGTFRAIVTELVPNEVYTIELSTNLINWEPRPPFTAEGTSTPFADHDAGLTRQKFYRVRSGTP